MVDAGHAWGSSRGSAASVDATTVVHKRIGAHTRASISLACLPLAHIALVLLITAVSDAGVTWTSLVLTSFGMVVVAWVFAIADRDELGRRGHDALPSAKWALCAPVAYLWLRYVATRHDSWDGLAIVWLSIGNLLAIPLVFLLVRLWGAAFLALG